MLLQTKIVFSWAWPDNRPLPPEGSKTGIDLGDELLAQIIRLVQNSPLPALAKARSLIRAGKMAEAFCGHGDGALERAFTFSMRNEELSLTAK